MDIREAIEKHKIDCCGKVVVPHDIKADFWDFTDTNNVKRETFDIMEYTKEKGTSIKEELDLEAIDIDPMFVFLGTCENDYVYGVVDRKIYQHDDGRISNVLINTRYLLDAQTNGTFTGCKDVEFVKASIFEDLDYVGRTMTDGVVGVGEVIKPDELLKYNNAFYKKLEGYGVKVLPCGEDDENFYCYVVYVGNLVLDTEPAFGMYLLTTPDGKIILYKSKKA